MIPGRRPAQVWHRYAEDHHHVTDLDRRVHVWRARVDCLAGDLGANLSEDEQARADRFYRAEDRDRFITTRAVLRRILAACLDRDDEPKGCTLRFSYGPTGKPMLRDNPGLQFNVAHAEGLALIAVTRAGPVGIDIERDRPMKNMDGIARMVFDDAEKAALFGCPPAARAMVFYRTWTRKEALIKAIGTGLPALGDPAAASLKHDGASWFMMGVPHLDGYAAALARPRGAHGVKLWSWPNAFDLRDVERRERPRPMPTQPSSSSVPLEVRS